MITPVIEDFDRERLLEVAATHWHKMKRSGVKPDLRLISVGRDLGFTPEEINRISVRVQNRLNHWGPATHDEAEIWLTQRKMYNRSLLGLEPT